MPRRKITIEEAFRTLDEAGIRVSVQPKVEEPQVIETPIRVSRTTRSNSKQQRIILFAKHCVGDNIYGPGEVVVTNEMASHLLYQDQQAREYDRSFRSTEFKCRVVAQIQGPNGLSALRGIPVPESVFQNGFNLNNVSARFLL